MYIDGGEAVQVVDGVAETRPRPINHTLSIGLSQSWTNSNVSIRTIDKPSSALFRKYINLWPYKDSFYAWGGDKGLSKNVEDGKLWKFAVDGAGGGSWEKQPLDNSAFLLLVTAQGCVCSFNGTGFIVGGWASRDSDATLLSIRDHIAVPGVTSFDMLSGKWKNQTAPGLSTSETIAYGRSLFVSFGPNGLILVLGGLQSTSQNRSLNFGEGQKLDFINLKLYDPVRNVWHSQQATGAFPSPRASFCTVGVQGPNNTYEM